MQKYLDLIMGLISGIALTSTSLDFLSNMNIFTKYDIINLKLYYLVKM